jgi:zinc protease
MAHVNLPTRENITRVELANGIIVLVYENPHVESVVITGSLEAGSLFETPAENGLASLTATALMHGTHHRDFDALHNALEDIGADLSLGAGYHSVNFGGKALAEDLPVLLGVLNDVLRYPTFPADHLQQLKQQRVTELKYSEDDTRYRAGLMFREMVYPPQHPYHYSTYGTLTTVPHFTAEQVRTFHQRHYGPAGMIVCIVGAIQPAVAVELIRARLEDWQNPAQPALPTLPTLSPPAEMQQRYSALRGKTQSSIVMGTLGPARSAPNFQAAVLANSVLGEFGMMGRIGTKIRQEMGLAYYAYSRLEGTLGTGTWSIAAGVAPENVAITIDAALAEVRRFVREPVSAADLADNQSYFTGRLPLRLENSAGIASTLQMMERYQLGLDYLERYAERIYQLTPADLLSAAQQYLDPERLVIAVAGPVQ